MCNKLQLCWSLIYIGRLYQIEQKARGKLPEGKQSNSTCAACGRSAAAGFRYAVHLAGQEPKGSLVENIDWQSDRRCAGQWKHLVRYLKDGRAPLDNNVIERDILPFTTGRKAWLLSDTVAGAKASANIYSIMLTCCPCNIETYSFLRYVFTELPQRPTDADITDLLPFNFQPQTAPSIA